MLRLVACALLISFVAVAAAELNSAVCGDPPIPPVESNGEETGFALHSRIVGGTVAKPGSWPWQVQLIAPSALFGTLTHMCGGSIIDNAWIVTAAHCLKSHTTSTSWTVKAGSFHKSSIDNTEQTSKVERVIFHSNYNEFPFDNDIAIMELRTPFTWTDHVRPVCLPASGASDLPSRAATFATGFGETKGTGHADKLKQTLLPFVSQTSCRTAYPGQISDNMICAGYYLTGGGHDACQGDSGGPLVAKLSGKWYLYGVTSWGRGCGLNSHPGVYCKVSNYISWIQNNINS